MNTQYQDNLNQTNVDKTGTQTDRVDMITGLFNDRDSAERL